MVVVGASFAVAALLPSLSSLNGALGFGALGGGQQRDRGAMDAETERQAVELLEDGVAIRQRAAERLIGPAVEVARVGFQVQRRDGLVQADRTS